MVKLIRFNKESILKIIIPVLGFACLALLWCKLVVFTKTDSLYLTGWELVNGKQLESIFGNMEKVLPNFSLLLIIVMTLFFSVSYYIEIEKYDWIKQLAASIVYFVGFIWTSNIALTTKYINHVFTGTIELTKIGKVACLPFLVLTVLSVITLALEIKKSSEKIGTILNCIVCVFAAVLLTSLFVNIGVAANTSYSVNLNLSNLAFGIKFEETTFSLTEVKGSWFSIVVFSMMIVLLAVSVLRIFFKQEYLLVIQACVSLFIGRFFFSIAETELNFSTLSSVNEFVTPYGLFLTVIATTIFLISAVELLINKSPIEILKYAIIFMLTLLVTSIKIPSFYVREEYSETSIWNKQYLSLLDIFKQTQSDGHKPDSLYAIFFYVTIVLAYISMLIKTKYTKIQYLATSLFMIASSVLSVLFIKYVFEKFMHSSYNIATYYQNGIVCLVMIILSTVGVLYLLAVTPVKDELK